MGRYLRADKSEYKSVPPGNHPAVCDQIVLLGYQRGEWKGKTKIQEKVWIRWQVPSERIVRDGVDVPATIGRTYTISLYGLAALRRHLESWRGRAFTKEEEQGFDIKNLLGKPCLVQVVDYEKHDGSRGTRVDSVTRLPKIMSAPAVEGAEIFFDVDDHTPEQLAALYPWQQEMVNNRIDMNTSDPGGIIAESSDPGYSDSDVPF